MSTNKRVVQCKYCATLQIRSNWSSHVICFRCKDERTRLRRAGKVKLLSKEIPPERRLSREDLAVIEIHLSGVFKEQPIIETYMRENRIPGSITSYLYYDSIAGVDGILRIDEKGMKKLAELNNFNK